MTKVNNALDDLYNLGFEHGRESVLKDLRFIQDTKDKLLTEVRGQDRPLNFERE